MHHDLNTFPVRLWCSNCNALNSLSRRRDARREGGKANTYSADEAPFFEVNVSEVSHFIQSSYLYFQFNLPTISFDNFATWIV